ncbi:hypothetical protein G8A07_11710 [Roseateles sp. DAIF2]|uniref:PilW family protein n=1 Tax=Roseateles sp. DAIF2 TaxID=2714952 RepID=UPI0018A2587A|nr:hypothetical protein [Roseateles sp. DAIF2]QPF73520.1 hypothetical protein G8A07_11710 [Roseateles sp. DAIF2]
MSKQRPLLPLLRQRRQAGASLVALMVGMLISMLAVVAGMALYRTALQQAAGPRGVIPASQLDGQLASGLLAAQIALQEAGFGIADASSAQHLVLLSNARLDGNRLQGTPVLPLGSGAVLQGNALLWVTNRTLAAAPNVRVCQGLLSEPGDNTFVLLSFQGDCQALAANWPQLGWQRRSLVGPNLLQQPVALDVQVNIGSCWPYGALPEAMTGQTAPSAAVRVGLTYGGSVEGSGNRYLSCLANFLQ